MLLVKDLNMMKKDVLVSIITPCLNAERTIRKTIESVLNQTYSNIEYWIIDGESTDATIDIIKTFNDTRIHLISEKDSGIYDAMNKGIRHSSGDIIGIINSDDWYELDAVSYMVENYEPGEYMIQYGYENEWNGDMCYMTWIKYHQNVINGTIPHPTCFVSKEVYEKYGGYDINYPICADREFMVRCLKTEDVRYVPHQKIIANFLDGGMSTNPQLGKQITLEQLMIKYKYGYIDKKTFKKKKFRNMLYYALKAIV